MGFGLIVIGASWGGLHALAEILPQLRDGFSIPIVVIQHRGADGPSGALASSMSSNSSKRVTEIEDKDPIEPGRVYLAPADYHLLVEPGHFALSTEAAVGFARPSIDVTLESAADSYGESLVAVLLTGANDDGSKGIAHVKRNGGFVIAQDPAGAERPAMPRSAIETGLVDLVVPLDEIGRVLSDLVDSPARESR